MVLFYTFNILGFYPRLVDSISQSVSPQFLKKSQTTYSTTTTTTIASLLLLILLPLVNQSIKKALVSTSTNLIFANGCGY